MYKIKIVMNYTDLEKENVKIINDAIMALIKKRNMMSDEENWYTGSMTECGSLITTLSEQSWFMENVFEWLLWDIKHNHVENLIELYREGN